MNTQKDVLSKLKSVQSTDSLPPFESPNSKSADNMDITGFLFELIKQTKGQEGLKDIVVNSALDELLNKIDVNLLINNLIRETFFCSLNVPIPQRLTENHEGFIFSASSIDPTNMLSIDPNSSEGKFIYDSNDPSKSVNCLIFSAQYANSTNPVKYIKNNKTLFTLFSEGGNQFHMHIGAEYANKELSTWAEDYMGDISFFNVANFVSQLVDMITGVISIKSGKSVESLENSSSILTAFSKLFGFCQNEPSDLTTATNSGSPEQEPSNFININPNTFLTNKEKTKNYGEDNKGNIFNFTSEELIKIQDDSRLRIENKVRFTTCGNFDVEIDQDTTIDGMNKLFSESDAGYNVVVNGVPTPAYDNNLVVPNIPNTATFIQNLLNDNVQKYTNESAGNENGTSSANDIAVNLPNMQIEFDVNVFKAIPYAVTQMVITPQLLILVRAASEINANETEINVTFGSVINQLSNLIAKIGNTIWESLLTKIYNLLLTELTSILSTIGKKFLTERIISYLGILTYIINLIKGFAVRTGSCQGILDSIMSLLSLSNFGPSFPVPPPLVYAGGILKPGLNKVAVVNDLKADLSKKGMEVGAYLPDGTPNYMMSALESTVDVLIKNITQKSRLDVMVNGITGPAIGYGQIS